MRDLVCAVDVGTGSARAGIFDRQGRMLGRAEHPIAMNRPGAGHAEHDSEDIWRAVCEAVKAVRGIAEAQAGRIAGIGFDATCSLVVRGRKGEPVCVSSDGDPRWDTLVWLDHRALGEADEITANGHRVLDHVGGVMSPEMQTPKLLWLKRNMPATWAGAGYFFDLSDFLTWKACGSTARSQCTLTAKWTYLAHDDGWQDDFLAAIGLADMRERGSLPQYATPVGVPLGRLSPDAAQALGLDTQCVVASGLIDAFSGALGTIGGYDADEIEHHVALIAGTSSCLMGMGAQPRQGRGLWGPYYGAAIPDLWLWEGGQSATGALLDHMVQLFGGGRAPDAATHRAVVERISALRRLEGESFAAGIHVLPDFHGNRSPVADPRARGVISGLTLDRSFDNLCRVYFKTALAIALGLRQIVEHLNAIGVDADTLHVCGGHRHNPLLMELYADASGATLCEPISEDAVLLGTGMAAAAAAGLHDSLRAACRQMRRDARQRPRNAARAGGYERDYRIMLAMQGDRARIERIERGQEPA